MAWSRSWKRSERTDPKREAAQDARFLVGNFLDPWGSSRLNGLVTEMPSGDLKEVAGSFIELVS